MIDSLRSFDRPTDPSDLAMTLGRAVMAGNAALRHRIQDESDLAGMGTTLVALLCSQSVAVLANLGDSRAYLRRRDSPTTARTSLITEDHTCAHLLAAWELAFHQCPCGVLPG